LPSLRARLAQIPDGAGVLFFIQIFATLGFAVLYSTLVLYATQHLHFPAKQATAIMGVFGAFNYGLHLFGGYLGGRFLSNRNLFVGGMILQVLGCGCISGGSVALLYWGLALFLTGSGLNVTCINMMLTQRFKPDDVRREGAFLWNYAGMNIGFFVGFAAAGHYQLEENYSGLFIFATIGNFIAIVIAAAFWKTLADRNTTLLEETPRRFRGRFAVGVGILGGLVPIVWILLQHPGGTERRGDLGHESCRAPGVKRRFGGDQLSEARPAHEAHCDEQQPAVLPRFIDRDHVWVLEPRGDVRLAHEACTELGIVGARRAD